MLPWFISNLIFCVRTCSHSRSYTHLLALTLIHALALTHAHTRSCSHSRSNTHLLAPVSSSQNSFIIFNSAFSFGFEEDEFWSRFFVAITFWLPSLNYDSSRTPEFWTEYFWGPPPGLDNDELNDQRRPGRRCRHLGKVLILVFTLLSTRAELKIFTRRWKMLKNLSFWHSGWCWPRGWWSRARLKVWSGARSSLRKKRHLGKKKF